MGSNNANQRANQPQTNRVEPAVIIDETDKPIATLVPTSKVKQNHTIVEVTDEKTTIEGVEFTKVYVKA